MQLLAQPPSEAHQVAERFGDHLEVGAGSLALHTRQMGHRHLGDACSYSYNNEFKGLTEFELADSMNPLGSLSYRLLLEDDELADDEIPQEGDASRRGKRNNLV